MIINKNKFFRLLIFFGMMLLYFIFNLYSIDSNLFYYIILLMAYIIMFCITLCIFAKKKIFWFEPMVMVTVFFWGNFILRPLFDIVNDDLLTGGINTWSGCVLATVTAVLSYICICIGYYRKGGNATPQEDAKVIQYSSKVRLPIICINLIIWLISYLAVVLYVLLNGASIQYIFSFGLSGIYINRSTTSMVFLASFAYTMLIPWLIICYCSKSMVLKLLITYLTLNITIVRGTRIFLMCLIVGFFSTYVILNKKKISNSIIVGGGAIVLVIFSLIQYSRSALRSGSGLSTFGEYNITESLFNVFDAEFTTYKQFYGYVESFPSKEMFGFGVDMVMTCFTQWIPRFIWQSKPKGISNLLEFIFGDSVLVNILGVPYLGQLYYEFGLLGCLFFSVLLGVLLRKLTTLYTNNIIYVEGVICYGVLYGVMFNYLIRGGVNTLLLNFFMAIIAIIVNQILFNKNRFDDINKRRGVDENYCSSSK